MATERELDMSAETMARSAWLTAKRRAEASTASAIAPDPSHGSAASAPHTPPPELHGSGGGGDIPATPRSNGGGGNDGSGKSFGFKIPKMSIILSCCAILTGLSIVYQTYWRTTSEGSKIESQAIEVDKLQAQGKIAAASGAVPPGWTSVKNETPKSVEQAPHGQDIVQSVKTFFQPTAFACGNDEETTANFAKYSPQDINLSSQSVSFGLACSHVTARGNVSQFEGKNYAILVKRLDVVPGDGNQPFWGCGDIAGLGQDREGGCKSFLKRYEGQPMRITVNADGYLKFN